MKATSSSNADKAGMTARIRIGARVWKTALAVTVAIAISRLLRIDHPVFAGVAAIICMQPTVAGSLRSGTNRMQATVIGAVFSLLALIALEEFPSLSVIRPAVVGLTVLVVMVVTLFIGWVDSLVLAAATVVVIMVLPSDENIYHYAFTRTAVTFIGIVVATVVNAVFITPRHSEPLWRNILKLTEATAETYRKAVEAFCERKPELALEAMESLGDTKSLLDSVSKAQGWVEEEVRLRKTVGWPLRGEADALGRAVTILGSIREAGEAVLEVTTEVHDRETRYLEHTSEVYEILWELAQPSLALFQGVVEEMSSPRTNSAGLPAWTPELHRRFVGIIRERRSEVYPLVEICVVEFEIRRVTELLTELHEIVRSSTAR